MHETTGRRLGVWLVGARGAIATCLAYGVSGLRQGLIEPIGVATAGGPFAGLPLVGLDELVLGGHDVVRSATTVSDLVRHHVLPANLVAAGADDAARFTAAIRPGVLDGPDVGAFELDPESARLGAAPQREQIAKMRADLEAFRAEHELDRVVVVCIASTEALRADRPCWATLDALDAALDADDADLAASSVYAYAALSAGMPFVNFTPNAGARPMALRELARREGVPHCGNDGKTGETLLKTALAPMFAKRALKVLAWQGYNMLGNKDGEALADPIRREAKKKNKDEALRAILADPKLHTEVGIDFVPSLHDWKTAWDFIHFEGFLGARMSMQVTWQGSDSALAAPLVIDLVRLADLAAAREEAGEMEHVGCYFKSPLSARGPVEHDFHAQFAKLLDYAARARGDA
jgi:myo-inositol-1-phosphate synthase